MTTRPNLARALPRLRRAASRFIPYIKTQRWLIVSALAAMLAEVGLRLLEPWPLKFVFDRIIGADAAASPVESATLLLLLAAGAVVALAGLRAAASYFSTVGLALAGNRVMTACRGELFAHLQRLSLKFHAKAQTGDLITRLITDVGRLQDVAVTAAMPLIAHSLMLIGMIVVLLILDWRLALIAMAVFPLFVIFSARLSKRIRAVAKQQRHQEGQMAASAAESMAGMKLVQAYGLEDLQQRAFQKQNQASLREGVKGQRLSARLERSVDVLVALATAGVLWAGAWLAMRGEITPGDLIVILAYLKNAFKPMRDMAKFTARIARAGASADRILDVLEAEPDIKDRPDAIAAPMAIAELRLAHVGFEYAAGQTVLDDVQFAVRPGQMIAIVGPSGSGKSTLASLLLRLYEPTAGTITINGRDIRDFTLQSLRARCAVVLQESVLFGVSIRENIAYGNPAASQAQIENAARLAGAHEFITAMPDRYDSIIGERGQTLSGGQRQRLALARAALRQAPILILDEPTTGLDQESENRVIEALDRLKDERLTLLITHDLPSVVSADAILYLDHGRVVERGTHRELMQLDGRYAATYRLQNAGRSADANVCEWAVAG